MTRVVLCRPGGPRNVGSILRVAANFGPVDVFIVGPIKPSLLIHPDFEQMAHGVPGMAERIRVVETVDEALAGTTASYGFTARTRDHRAVRDWCEVRPEMVRRASASEEQVALVFGSEESGLSGAECAPLHELVRMSTSEEHGSLNLAMCVGIVLSTLFYADAEDASSDGSTPLPQEARKFLIARLQDALGKLTLSDPARRDLVASIERVFARSPLETRDGRAWHLLARAVDGEKAPSDYGLSLEARE